MLLRADVAPADERLAELRAELREALRAQRAHALLSSAAPNAMARRTDPEAARLAQRVVELRLQIDGDDALREPRQPEPPAPITQPSRRSRYVEY